jgi:hypothetical protein
MKIGTLLRTILVACLLLRCAALSSAEGVAVEPVLIGLNGPAGVAVRPSPSGAYEIYVAEGGAGRIVRVRSDQPNASTEVIRGLPVIAPDKGASESIGLTFLDRERLVVLNRSASGDSTTGAAIARLYEVPTDGKPLAADAMKQHVDLPADTEPPTPDAQSRGHFALARTRANDHVPDMLLVISPDAGRSGELSRIPARAGTFGELGVFPLAKERLPAGAPTTIAVSEQGYVVLSFTDGDSSRESHLAFVNPIDGSVVMSLTIDLPGVTGLAYSTNSSALYAIASAPTAGNEGGVYRIDSAGQLGKPAARAVKLADVTQPTAIAAGPDGTLYVTELGKSSDTSTAPGQLLKLTGEL